MKKLYKSKLTDRIYEIGEPPNMGVAFLPNTEKYEILLREMSDPLFEKDFDLGYLKENIEKFKDRPFHSGSTIFQNVHLRNKKYNLINLKDFSASVTILMREKLVLLHNFNFISKGDSDEDKDLYEYLNDVKKKINVDLTVTFENEDELKEVLREIIKIGLRKLYDNDYDLYIRDPLIGFISFNECINIFERIIDKKEIKNYFIKNNFE